MESKQKSIFGYTLPEIKCAKLAILIIFTKATSKQLDFDKYSTYTILMIMRPKQQCP